MNLARMLKILAWLALLGLVFVTLSPIEWRPVSPLPTQIERALALAIIGFCFAIAYPRHIVLVGALLLGVTMLLELLQLVAPSRHGRVVDVAVKLIGASIGLAIGWLGERRLRRS